MKTDVGGASRHLNKAVVMTGDVERLGGRPPRSLRDVLAMH